MDKRSVWQFILSVLLVTYLAVVIPLSVRSVGATPPRGMQIVVSDPEKVGFVTAADVSAELDSLYRRISSIPRSQINTLAIEDKLNGLDRIDRATCVMLNNGILRLDVRPMKPVARLFDSSGASCYVSADGKRIGADIHYQIDLPVVTADFDSLAQAADVIAVLDYIKSDPVADALVSGVKVDSRGDIILVPIIRGHVINFGDSSARADKWARLKTLYNKVMPVKGWEYYDTISVKWRGQVVATRRTKAVPEPSIELRMLTDTLLPDAAVVEIEAAESGVYESDSLNNRQ